MAEICNITALTGSLNLTSTSSEASVIMDRDGSLIPGECYVEPTASVSGSATVALNKGSTQIATASVADDGKLVRFSGVPVSFADGDTVSISVTAAASGGTARAYVGVK
jgi:hypothetical protein